MSSGQHTLYVHAKNNELVWGSTYVTITFTKVTSSDTTAPVVTFNPSTLSSLYTVSAITAVSFSGTSDEDGTLYV
ncbi:MAG: hypothetical protein Q8O99_03855, partial [bacterium]|nr:hypothetical protein [bacterium]